LPGKNVIRAHSSVASTVLHDPNKSFAKVTSFAAAARVCGIDAAAIGSVLVLGTRKVRHVADNDRAINVWLAQIHA